MRDLFESISRSTQNKSKNNRIPGYPGGTLLCYHRIQLPLHPHINVINVKFHLILYYPPKIQVKKSKNYTDNILFNHLQGEKIFYLSKHFRTKKNYFNFLLKNSNFQQTDSYFSKHALKNKKRQTWGIKEKKDQTEMEC